MPLRRLGRVLVLLAVISTVLVTSSLSIPRPPVAGAATSTGSPSSGFWTTGTNGSVYSWDGAPYFGSTAGIALNRPVVGMAPTPDGNGYWLVASDGGVFTFGDAGFYGSTGGIVLNKPVVGMASTPDGRGYWLVASDGGVFTFGDAGFYGSTGAIVLNKPVVGMASTPDGHGYWLVASDGGIFTFGDAPFYGSTGAMVLNKPVVGMASTSNGSGYWLVASDGGIFTFGSAPFYGSTGALSLTKPVVGMAAAPTGGYYLLGGDDSVYPFGNTGAGGQIPASAAIVGGSEDAAMTSAQSSSSVPAFQDGFSSLPLGLGWADGSTHGSWVDQFNGYGTSGIVSDTSNALALIPATSTSPSQTHSALVTSQQTFGDLDVTYQYRTVSQLRTGSPPNSWEVGWALWHETDNQHFYYVLLKPDGWELGKEDPAYPGSQRFLATGSSPTFAVGVWHTIRVVQVGSSITVYADGSLLVSFTDTERPYLSGSLGLYCEDSEVHFVKVVVQ